MEIHFPDATAADSPGSAEPGTHTYGKDRADSGGVARALDDEVREAGEDGAEGHQFGPIPEPQPEPATKTLGNGQPIQVARQRHGHRVGQALHGFDDDADNDHYVGRLFARYVGL